MASKQLESDEDLSFLHRLDSVEGETLVVQTTRSQLRSASFLDGREKFWTSEHVVPLDLVPTGSRRAHRFVFHVGFCGSTLLARLLDRPDGAIVLKESQCLADLAGQRAAIANGNAVAPLGRLVDYALDRMGEAGGDTMPVVLKPTNWVNSLLPELCAPGCDVRAVFVSMDRRAYLGAVFRGGRSRLEFCTRLAAALAPVVPGGNQALRSAVESDGDPFERTARIAALLHAMQETLFASAIAANGWPANVRVDFADLASRPELVLPRVRTVLGLAPASDDAGRSSQVMARHTKDSASAFDPSIRRREDDEIERHHGKRFDAALQWLADLSGAASP